MILAGVISSCPSAPDNPPWVAAGNSSSGSTGNSSSAGGSSSSIAGGSYTIHMIGDSITAMDNSRVVYETEFTGAGIIPTWVGSQTDGNGENHDGYSGQTIEQVSDLVINSNLAAGAGADITMILLGANNIISGANDQAVLSNYSNMIESIYSQNSSTRVVCGMIHPRDTVFTNVVEGYNDNIRTLVTYFSGRGEKIGLRKPLMLYMIPRWLLTG